MSQHTHQDLPVAPSGGAGDRRAAPGRLRFGGGESDGATDGGVNGGESTGFSIMVAQSNDADDYWGKFAAQYSDETGVEVEVIPYPGDAYNTQITNAAADDGVKKAAQEFLDWAAEEQQAQTFADLSGLIAITGVDAAKLPAPYQPIGELLEQGSFVDAPLATFPNPAAYDALATGVQGLLTGQKTVDQVLDEMDSAWDA